MKKIIAITIGLIILFPASFAVIYQAASAEVLKTCDPKKVESYFAKSKKEVDAIFDDPKKKKTFSDLKFRVRFEKARKEYHDFVSCVFDVSTVSILGSAGGVKKDIPPGSLPNLENYISDLLNPDKACLKQNDIQSIFNDSSPGNLITPMLKVYQKYIEHLRYLYNKISENPTINNATVDNYSQLFANNQKFKLLVNNEIQDSIVALDTAFIALKELRQAYIMHIHFQCMIKNLGMYRKAMSNLRSVVSAMPPLFNSASMHK